MSKQRRTFSADFKRSAAFLVLDQSYSHVDASRSVGGAGSVCADGVNNRTRNEHLIQRLDAMRDNWGERRKGIVY